MCTSVTVHRAGCSRLHGLQHTLRQYRLMRSFPVPPDAVISSTARCGLSQYRLMRSFPVPPDAVSSSCTVRCSFVQQVDLVLPHAWVPCCTTVGTLLGTATVIATSCSSVWASWD